MCEECLREYENPRDRRFHAQPNACPECGPRLELWEKNQEVTARNDAALLLGAEIVRQGKVLAVKGLGGFHLIVDGRNDAAVQLLRKRKHREEKPFALMYPSLESVEVDCVVSEIERRLLESPEAPIVILERRRAGAPSGLAPSVAPCNPFLGVMLPYTPLHHLLMHELGFPIVATSGNLSDEPICIDEQEALDRLGGIADAFLVHDRPIVRHVDDSVVRLMGGREMIMRRARGYAPLPLSTLAACEDPILAVGAHLKNTVALSVGDNVFVSQHIGDLETGEASAAFQRVTKDLQQLFDEHPRTVVCDMHPEYLSTKYSAGLGVNTFKVQHHYAHVASCMAENDLQGRVLGVAWDGTGYGPDGTIWGGEFLLTDDSTFSRVASFRPFRLPGGDRAIKEPRRAAVGALFELFGDALFHMGGLLPVASFAPTELKIVQTMLGKTVNSPLTTSAGRMFDAVASLIGLRQQVAFEGQAAMELEFAIGNTSSEERYRYEMVGTDPMDEGLRQYRPLMVFDWSSVISQILDDVGRRESISTIAARFHNTLCEVIVDVARRSGEPRVVLSGGCFQNKYLTERSIRRLKEEGFRPYWHQRVPPNDGGIALGQINAFRRSKPGHAGVKSVTAFSSTMYDYQHKGEETVR